METQDLLCVFAVLVEHRDVDVVTAAVGAVGEKLEVFEIGGQDGMGVGVVAAVDLFEKGRCSFFLYLARYLVSILGGGRCSRLRTTGEEK
jgi:hypothetical protein